jgi:tRNA threonylcarbamoyladenosine biosynthesis protein TsaB
MRHGHAEALLPMIDRVTSAAEVTPAQLEAIAVTVGPGGFTGIRAGLAAAQGIALASGAQLLGVTGFAAVAALVPPNAQRLLVAIDSRRADFYVQLFERNGEPCSTPASVPPERLPAWLGDDAVRIAGNAAEAAAAALSRNADATVVRDTATDAAGVLAALRRWPGSADTAARAVYLRPPDVSFPKSRGGAD